MTTRRATQHRLVTLAIWKKVLSSTGLLLGLALFLATTLFEVILTDWQLSLRYVIFDWGGVLMGVREREPTLFGALFVLHGVSLAMVLTAINALFRHLAMPRGGRALLSAIVLSFGVADIASWALLTTFAFAQHALGPIVAVETVLLFALALRPLHDMWVFTRWRGGDRPVRVAVVGGGFAGLYAAMGLDKALGYHPNLEIVVLDRKNYFLFPPLLPSVAAGAIETRQVTYPFRRIFEATNITFKKENVLAIDLDTKTIQSRVEQSDGASVERAERYDFLVLAPGSETNTFGTPGVAKHAFFMRELGDAIAVRNQIIDCFERAACESNVARRKELLSFVVVGAGPTGVELASEVRDLVEHVLLNRYPEIDPSLVSVHIVQSGGAILPGFDPSIVDHATAQLRKLSIRVLLQRRVVAVDERSVTLDGDEKIFARTCVWCAGVKPSPLLAACRLPLHASGRVEIAPDLRVKGRSDAFVLGDAALLMHEGKPLPPLGQVAFQQGAHCAANIVRLLRGKATKPFAYFNFGALVSVGEHYAAVKLFGVRLTGFVAWIVWRALYLMKLVGFSNKVRVLLDWSLDLLVERSISQIAATRQDLAESSQAASSRGTSPATTTTLPMPRTNARALA